MRVRTWMGIMTLGAMVAFGCSDRVSGPTDSGPTEPPPDVPADVVGALEVSISVTGSRPDPNGYTVVINVEELGDRASRTVQPAGGTARFAEVPPGRHIVVLQTGDNCSAEHDYPRPFTIAARQTTRTEFNLFCPGPSDVAGVYEHDSADGSHEIGRYVIEEDGTFRWQHGSSGLGLSEKPGTYALERARIIFQVDGANWGVGTLHGACLTVTYDDDWPADAYDVEYCMPPGGSS